MLDRRVSLLAVAGAFSLTVACTPRESIDPAALDALHRPHAHAGEHPPNIILIVLDTARADRFSFNGYGRRTSPHLDRFAADAVLFDQAHSVAPWTLPSHMSMFTGLLPGQHGANWTAFAEPAEMDMGEILSKTFQYEDAANFLPEKLRSLGYSTVGFSSNAWISPRTGFDVGFDAFYETWRQKEELTDRYAGLPTGVKLSEDFDLADAGVVLTQLKLHALQEGGDLPEPFFLFFNFIDPHYPYSPPPLWRYQFSADDDLGESIAAFEFDEMAMGAGDQPVDVSTFSPFYDAEISFVDFAAGRLLAWLEDKDYYDDALIIVTSDHGEHLGESGKFSHQFSVDEELIAVPLAVKFPGGQRGGETISDPLVSNLDVYRTILNATGFEAALQGPPTPSIDLADPIETREALISEYYHSPAYLRQNQAVYEGFPVEEHRMDRRVIFTRDGRFEINQRAGEFAQVSGPTGEAADKALRTLQAYVESLKGGRLTESEAPMDPATLERLKSLGYVQ